MIQKYKKGDRVKVTVGQLIWQNNNGNVEGFDLHPEYTKDIGTIEHSYYDMSLVDPKYSSGEEGKKAYCINFDKYGEISWFNEKNIYLV